MTQTEQIQKMIKLFGENEELAISDTQDHGHSGAVIVHIKTILQTTYKIRDLLEGIEKEKEASIALLITTCIAEAYQIGYSISNLPRSISSITPPPDETCNAACPSAPTPQEGISR